MEGSEYSLEYASSGRAMCRATGAHGRLCAQVFGGKIQKGELRLKRVFAANGHDFDITHYHHWTCVSDHILEKLIDRNDGPAGLAGYAGLTAEDQARVDLAFELKHVPEGRELQEAADAGELPAAPPKKAAAPKQKKTKAAGDAPGADGGVAKGARGPKTPAKKAPKKKAAKKKSRDVTDSDSDADWE